MEDKDCCWIKDQKKNMIDIFTEVSNKIREIENDGCWPLSVFVPKGKYEYELKMVLISSLPNDNNSLGRKEKILGAKDGDIIVYGLPVYFTGFEKEIKIGYRRRA